MLGDLEVKLGVLNTREAWLCQSWLLELFDLPFDGLGVHC